MRYADQQAWKDIQMFLPRDKHLTVETTPVEEDWEWQGHRIHLDRLRNPAAPARVILFHGVGTNGRQLSLIAGAPLFRLGYDVVAVDMPGYGLTEPAPGTKVTYDDWVALAVDLILAESEGDGRPVFLYGLSAGGMLAYHAAACFSDQGGPHPLPAGGIAGIMGMTFLDQREEIVRDKTSRDLFMSRVGAPLAHLAAPTLFSGIKIPMSLAAKMRRLVNNREALRVFLGDRTSAGNWMSLGFLSSYLRYWPAVEPEAFDLCPILLTQPAADTWTPLSLSELFLDRFQHVTVKTVMLDNAGHYPMEEPGLTQLEEAMGGFMKEAICSASPR